MSTKEMKPKSEMTEAEIMAMEEAEFQTGPLSLLTTSVKSGTQILIMTRYVLYSQSTPVVLGYDRSYDLL